MSDLIGVIQFNSIQFASLPHNYRNSMSSGVSDVSAVWKRMEWRERAAQDEMLELQAHHHPAARTEEETNLRRKKTEESSNFNCMDEKMSPSRKMHNVNSD